MVVAVDKCTSPRSPYYGMWYVSVCRKYLDPFETVFYDKSKKACVEYAKTLCDKPCISNGIEYGAKW